MKIFHAYHKADEHGSFTGKEFKTDKNVSSGDILFVIIGKKIGKSGPTQYSLDGKFKVATVESNSSDGLLGDKKNRLVLTPVMRGAQPIFFSSRPDFDPVEYRNYFISTGGFKEIKPEMKHYSDFFESLMSIKDVAPSEENELTDIYTDEVEVDPLKRVMREILARRGQPKFRNDLLGAYSKRCCITGCTISELLEAAHINPYSDSGDNSVQNGVLLRSDIHTLFDQHLLTIDESCMIRLSKALMDSEYKVFQGKRINTPIPSAIPSNFSLRKRYEAFLEKEKTRGY